MERDEIFGLFLSYLYNFNSHAHVERDKKFGGATATYIHFNSHAHVERDKQAVYMQMSHDISTHTLTWSVTIHHQ